MKLWTPIFLLIFVAILAAGSLLLVSYNKNRKLQQNNPVTSKNTLKEIKEKVEIDLYLDPVQTSAKIGDEINYSIRINTKDLLLVGSETYLNYDPKNIQIINIQPGTVFVAPNILLNKIDSQFGKISYALGTFQPVAANGLLFKITGKILSKPANTLDLGFDKSKVKIALQSPKNSKLYSSDEVVVLYHETQMNIVN